MAKRHHAWVRFAGCLLFLTLLSGCFAPDIDTMSERVPGVANIFGAPSHGPALPVSIFVASTRHDGGKKRPRGSAHYALDMVSVPPDHRTGQIERPLFGRADPARNFALTLARPLGKDEFLNQVTTYLSGRVGSNRDILLYVHGYNTSEQEALFRLAQIVADGRFGGVPVLFTWPADGGPLSYVSDKDRATASRDALEKLLSNLSHVSGLGRIHVLAHSMGSWLAMEALRENAIAGHPSLDGRLGQVMLAAPDIDLSVFRQQLKRIGDPGRVSIFVSSNDRALSLSTQIHGDRPRLGSMNPRNPHDKAELKRLGVHVYDLSGYSDGFFGHGAFADMPPVIRSIGAELGAPRKSDSDKTSIIDLGVDRSPPPASLPPAPAGALSQNASPVEAATIPSAPPASPAAASSAQ
ncbi:MAG TPA: alpha/beta hydrolase [Beijerinckiaceae bacterium]|nr:alpha/beta hydrolase [Beijerinckiaceae bacterium]HVB89949.1 alpha/beta hydrolase [Beijerinckiaceae bacterium]